MTGIVPDMGSNTAARKDSGDRQSDKEGARQPDKDSRRASPSPPPRAEVSVVATAAAAASAPAFMGLGEVASRADAAESTSAAAAADPSSKYQANARGAGPPCLELQEICDLAEADDEAAGEEEDAASRALNWSLERRSASTTGSSSKGRHSLVFQSTAPMLKKDTPVAAASCAAATPTSVSGLRGPTPAPAEAAIASSCVPVTPAPAARSEHVQQAFLSQSTVLLPPTSAGATLERAVSKRLPSQPTVDDDDDDDEEHVPPTPLFLEAPTVQLEISPLMAEDPRKLFERYTRRLHERLMSATETSWDKLQERASEQLLGGVVGKLEFFWLHPPGQSASPDTAVGLVCFQFVQGFASNFARILHLSVAEEASDLPPESSTDTAWPGNWRISMPSAILQVRHFLFSMLPVDSLRSVVLAGEDDAGRIYVDAHIEVCYQQCRFRWFQLTQQIRRSKNSLRRKAKVKRGARFLVLSSPRQDTDPAAPRAAVSVGRLPAVVLRDELSPANCSATPTSKDADLPAPEEEGEAIGFSKI